MKKIISIFSCLLFLSLTSCGLFELDNYDEPNATVSGKIIDSGTNQPMNLECYTQGNNRFGVLTVVEQEWDAVAEQYWNVKFNGEYTNNRVFSGKYVMSTKYLPCYLDEKSFSLSAGKNNVDMTVTPYARVVNPTFTYDAATKKIKATFKIELGDKTKANVISQVKLCAYTDCHVCNNFNLCKDDPGASASNVTEGETITLEIDTTLAANAEEFKYVRKHYLRIAVLANGNGFNTASLYNFSDTYFMTSDFSTFDKFVW